MPQTPIDVDIDIADARKALGQYVRAIKAGATPLKGPCFIMCRACGYKAQAVDCSGRTSEDVGQDKEVWAEMLRLWSASEDPLEDRESPREAVEEEESYADL